MHFSAIVLGAFAFGSTAVVAAPVAATSDVSTFPLLKPSLLGKWNATTSESGPRRLSLLRGPRRGLLGLPRTPEGTIDIAAIQSGIESGAIPLPLPLRVLAGARENAGRLAEIFESLRGDEDDDASDAEDDTESWGGLPLPLPLALLRGGYGGGRRWGPLGLLSRFGRGRGSGRGLGLMRGGPLAAAYASASAQPAYGGLLSPGRINGALQRGGPLVTAGQNLIEALRDAALAIVDTVATDAPVTGTAAAAAVAAAPAAAPVTEIAAPATEITAPVTEAAAPAAEVAAAPVAA